MRSKFVRCTILELAADWHELMVQQRITQPLTDNWTCGATRRHTVMSHSTPSPTPTPSTSLLLISAAAKSRRASWRETLLKIEIRTINL